MTSSRKIKKDRFKYGIRVCSKKFLRKGYQSALGVEITGAGRKQKVNTKAERSKCPLSPDLLEL